MKLRPGRNGGTLKVPEKGDPSPNPKGRHKKLPDLDKLLADVLGSTDDDKSPARQIIEALQRRAAKGDVRAAEVLLDRGWGKVKQQIANDGEVTVTIKHES